MLTLLVSLIVASLFGFLAVIIAPDLDDILDRGAPATPVERFVLAVLLPSILLFAAIVVISEGTESLDAETTRATVRRAVRAILFGKAVA